MRRFLNIILLASGQLLYLNNSFAKDGPNDCDYKPILGFRLAQSKEDWGIEFNGNSKDGIDPKTFYFPIYGHWCGPGYPKAGESPIPFDALDELCKLHDLCYAGKGYSDCSCDQALVTAVRRAKSEKKHMVACKKNGKKIKVENPSYGQVEWYFTKEMDKRGCPRL